MKSKRGYPIPSILSCTRIEVALFGREIKNSSCIRFVVSIEIGSYSISAGKVDDSFGTWSLKCMKIFEFEAKITNWLNMAQINHMK